MTRLTYIHTLNQRSIIPPSFPHPFLFLLYSLYKSTLPLYSDTDRSNHLPCLEDDQGDQLRSMMKAIPT